MNGTNYDQSIELPKDTNSNAKIVATGDFDKDGNIDIVWSNGNKNSIWMMNGANRREIVDLPSMGNPDWKIVGAADFNKDSNLESSRA